MKDSEIAKLRFSSTSYKPLEYEKWIKTVSTTMKGLHPNIGRYWRAVCTLAEKTYEKYLNDLSFTGVSIFPSEVVATTPIEERIESRLKMMLTNILPQAIVRQCDDCEDVSCAQILYRTIVFAGPASKEDYVKMLDTLTKPRMIELDKLYNAMIEFRFARTRMKKYGYREPEPSQLFETLKAASVALSAKEPELHFRFQHYLMKHSSVNGLVNEQTVIYIICCWRIQGSI